MNTTIKLTPAEIARIFMMYPGAEMQHAFGQKDILNGVVYKKKHDQWCLSLQGYGDKRYGLIEAWKLLLTPIEKITDEHAIEVAKINGDNFINDRPNLTNILKYIRGNIYVWVEKSYMIYQSLVKEGYAAPVWLGIDHPANGKTPIELGIAIDKTTIK